MDHFERLRHALVNQGGTPATKTVGVEYAVTKADNEERYTFGILYVPGARDSDNEYATSDDLQKAVWNYTRSGYRKIRDTHTETEIGELVEIVAWPYETEAETKLPDGTVKKYRLPAGTVYAGVIWEPPAWELVKSGKLRGYSLGGAAVRVKEASDDDALPAMRDLLAEEKPERAVIFEPESQPVAATKDAFTPIIAGDRVAWSTGDGAITKQEGRVRRTEAGSRGQILFDVEWDDGDSSMGVPEYFLRNLTDRRST